jgi:hypothetical protein
MLCWQESWIVLSFLPKMFKPYPQRYFLLSVRALATKPLSSHLISSHQCFWPCPWEFKLERQKFVICMNNNSVFVIGTFQINPLTDQCHEVRSCSHNRRWPSVICTRHCPAGKKQNPRSLPSSIRYQRFAFAMPRILSRLLESLEFWSRCVHRNIRRLGICQLWLQMLPKNMDILILDIMDTIDAIDFSETND